MPKNEQEFYQRLSKRELEPQEVFEAKQNFVGFFDLLLTVDKRLKEKTNDQNK